jgi:hypothetical protein
LISTDDTDLQKTQRGINAHKRGLKPAVSTQREEIAKIARTAKIAEIEKPAIADIRKAKPPDCIRKLKINCVFL